MALFRSERGIGRGEVAESRIEAPFFAVFMVCCAVGLLVVHLYFGSAYVTVALAVSLVVFGTTVVRVDYGVYILVTAMLLSPEIFAGYKYSGERPLSIRYDDILIPVIFIGVLVKNSFEGRKTLWHPSPANAGIVAYYSICIISTLLALRANLPAWDRRTAFFTMLKMLEFYMVFVLVGNAVRTREGIRKQLTLFFLTAIVISVYALFSMRRLDRVGAPFEGPGGTEPNTLGGYLTLVMCVAGGLFITAPTRKGRWMFICLALMAFFPFLFTLSRASYVALIAALFTLGVAGRKPVILVLVVIVLVASPIVMPKKVMDRVNYTFQRGDGMPVEVAGVQTGLQVDKSTHERLYVWRKVRFVLQKAPWFGGGVSWESVMDSQYARVILETGLFGLLAFVFLQFRLLKTAWQAYRWSDRDWLGRGLALGVIACTVGLIVHSLGTISFVIVRIMEPFWLLMALTAVTRTLAWRDRARRIQAARAAKVAKQAVLDKTPPALTPSPTAVS